VKFSELRRYLGFIDGPDVFQYIKDGLLPWPSNGFLPNDPRAHWHQVSIDLALDDVSKRHRRKSLTVPHWADETAIRGRA
jgi:hypothetical protein